MIIERDYMQNQVSQVRFGRAQERFRASGAVLKMEPDHGWAACLADFPRDLGSSCLLGNREAPRGGNHQLRAELEKIAPGDPAAFQVGCNCFLPGPGHIIESLLRYGCLPNG